jgi:glycerol-3-phosphate cytidylyltransferase-like family protein
MRAEHTPLQVVTGHFDVLLAGHVRELYQVHPDTSPRKLLVVVIPPREPVLSNRARAEMVAALGVVDYVVTAEPDDRESLLAALEAEDVVAFEAADERRARQLIEHVQRRQTS